VRAILHVLSVIVLLPYLLLAACFLMLDRAIGTGSLPGFVDTLLTLAALLLSWVGVAILGALLLLILLGTSARTRGFAAAITCLAGVACVVVLVTLSHSTIGLPEALFLVPCVLALGGAGWLAANEWPFRTDVRTFNATSSPGVR
jgi:hypothetical protein